MSAQAPAELRSLLVIADRVHTLAAAPAEAPPTAVLVQDGIIAAIGQAADLRAQARDARVLELPGAALTPGLIDAHIHLTEWALARREVDLTTAASPQDAAALVVRQAENVRGEWIRGRGWNPHRWAGAEPDRHMLDRLLPDRPVLLQSHDMHALWVNSPALRLARIEADTPDPEGGRIVRDRDGAPTGLLLENAAQLVARCLPARTGEETADAVTDAQAELHALGITAVHSLPAIHVVEPEPLGVLEAMRARGRLRLRVFQHLPLRQLDEAIRIGLRSGFGGEWIRVGGVKMFLDGALGSRTAWMSAPYEGTDNCGLQVLDAGEFRYHVKRAARAGIATTVHAIGDAAVARAFDVLADPDVRVPGMPHRIEHVQCLPEGRSGDPARADITCSMQPAHLLTDWRIADRHWGRRAARTYALRTLRDAGARLAFGSDAPVEPADPRLGLYAATTRRDLDGAPATGWFPDQRLTLEEAFLGYTRWAAAAAAGPGGVLQPGAPADMVAWEPDPFQVRDDALLRLRCVATIVAGEIVRS